MKRENVLKIFLETNLFRKMNISVDNDTLISLDEKIYIRITKNVLHVSSQEGESACCTVTLKDIKDISIIKTMVSYTLIINSIAIYLC